MPYRISRPSTEGKYPLVIYLHSSTRNGDDNYSQLYQAQYLFNQLKDKAILVAPQAMDTWNTDDIAGLINNLAPSGEKVKPVYNAESKTLTLTAEDEDLNSALVIEAAYDGDTMTNVNLHTANFDAKTAIVTGIEISENERVYVWDSVAGMEPLSNVFTLSDNENADTDIENIDVDKIYIDGQDNGADAALKAAAANPDKIAAVIAAAPSVELTEEEIAAMSDANTAAYIFAEYGSEDFETVRKNVNGLQSAGMSDVMYTEYPFAQNSVARSADETDGITAVASLYTDEYWAQMRDAYHYHQPVYNSVGTIAGNNTAYTLYGTGTWTAYPEPDGKSDS